MKATVKEIAVFYGGQRYSKGEEVTLKEADYDEALFEKVESKGKKKSDKE